MPILRRFEQNRPPKAKPPRMKINTYLPLTKLATALALLVPFAAFADSAKKLEVFSWWTSGGEAAALDALFGVYKKANPGVEIINATVAGGGGSAARAVLQTRLAGGNPPDTWQSHPGWAEAELHQLEAPERLRSA